MNANLDTQPSGTIAVFGGTGQQGRSVVDALLSRSARVRALVRNPESDRARALADRGVELARIEIGDAASLSAALKGADAFFFMTTPEGHSLADIEGETRQGLALVDAAVAAAVPHVVYSSVGGAERDSGVPHFESKRRVEEHLQQSGLRATVVRPVAFMASSSPARPLFGAKFIVAWDRCRGQPPRVVRSIISAYASSAPLPYERWCGAKNPPSSPTVTHRASSSALSAYMPGV